MSCSSLLQALDVRECVCVYGASVLSLVQSLRPLGERVASAVEASRSTKELLMTLPCPSAQTVSKYDSQFHKLFQCVPKDELLMKGESAGTSSHSELLDLRGSSLSPAQSPKSKTGQILEKLFTRGRNPPARVRGCIPSTIISCYTAHI